MISMIKSALLFPGQGTENEQIIKFLLNAGKTLQVSMLCHVLKIAEIRELEDQSFQYINSNWVSSLLAVTASLVCVENNKNIDLGKIKFLCGYSIGQWTALYVSHSISLEQLFEIVTRRAQFMDEAVANTPSGMLSILGLSENVVMAIIEEINTAGIPCY